MNVIIRKATIDDLKVIQDLSYELLKHGVQFDKTFNMQWSHQPEGEKYFLSRINAEKAICFVAETNGQIVGYITGGLLTVQSWRPIKRAELENLYVKDSHRKKAIGKKLVDKFLLWCKENQIKKAVVYTFATNLGAHAFYQKQTFSPFTTILEADVK